MKLFGVAIVLGSVVVGRAAAQHVDPHLDDADLHAVVQIGSRGAWAVGDRGVAWFSNDSGRTWSCVALPERVDCRSLCFLTARVGWIAGDGHRSGQRTGVLLSTRDGGASWQRHAIPLAGVCHVEFFDLDHGIVVGHATAGHPSGLVETRDGGRSWRRIPGAISRDWRCAVFSGAASGVLAGVGTRVAAYGGKAVIEPVGQLRARRTWHAAAHSEKGISWLVGDGASVLLRPAESATWTTPSTALPAGLADTSDFRGVAAVGRRAWIVGFPGSVVWHTPDAGRHWERQSTGQPLPLRAIAMTATGQGIAVGGLGVILTTADGGRRWSIQRGQDRRLAALLIHAGSGDIPLGLVAKDSGESGYRSRGYLVVRPNDIDRALEMDRALRKLGAQGLDYGWRLSTRQPELERDATQLLRNWQVQTEGRLTELLAGRLTGLIRTWRPSVVVVDTATTDNHVSRLIRDATATAIADAADPTRWAISSAMTGLPAWSIRRAFERLPAGGASDVHVSPFDYLVQQDGTVANVVARAVLTSTEGAHRPWRGDRLRRFLGAGRSDAESVCGGLGLSPGGDARRRINPTSDRDASRITTAKRRARAIGAFLQLSETGGRASHASLQAELLPMLERMDKRQAGWTIWSLSESFRNKHRPELSQHLLRQLVRDFPDHAACGKALSALFQETASGEHRWQRLKRTTPLKISRSTDWRTQAAASEIQQSLHWAGRLQRKAPGLYDSANMQLAIASLFRSRGSPALADAIHRRLLNQPGPWQVAASQETWLTTPGTTPPAHLANCHFSARRPTLDALLSETCWQTGTELRLDSDAPRQIGQMHSFAMVAGDNDYLYLSASLVQHQQHAPQPSLSSARQFDAGQQGVDRVTFFLDTDRDYTLGYQLTIDHRGLVGERCGEDRNWNPRCYVAVAGDQQTWRLELAVPWDELVRTRPRPGQHWGLRIVRTIPSVGWESWGAVANSAGEPLAGAGLLSFTRKSPARSTR